MEDNDMKKWNTPDVTELNITETAGGVINFGFEGPFNIVFGDGSNKDGEKPSTPSTEEES